MESYLHTKLRAFACLAQQENIFAGCSKWPSSKASASEDARRTLRYVERLSDAGTKLADFFSNRLEYHEVVPVDDFLVFLRAELLLDLGRFEPFDPRQGVGGEIHESFGEFLAVLIETTDGISRIERAADAQDAGSQQALTPSGQRLDCSGVERQGPSRPEGEGDPMFATGEATLLREEEAAARTAS